MAAQEVSFKTKEHPEEVKVSYDFGDNLTEAIDKFGEEVVWSRAKGALVIDLQAYGRRLIDFNADEKNTEKKDIVALCAAWKPDVRSPVVKKSAAERAAEAISQMSAEDKAALLASLQNG